MEPIAKADWEAECKRVAGLLDKQPVSIRNVRAHHVEAHWNAALGKPPRLVPLPASWPESLVREGQLSVALIKCRDAPV